MNHDSRMDKPHLKISSSHWDLHEKIVSFYRRKGIREFFEWQAKCLNLPGVLNGTRNLVYSAPTSAGKTMISDVLLYKALLQRKKKAIVILPFVAIVEEKVNSMRQLLSTVGFKMDSFAGNSNPRGGFDQIDVAVCTIEKANNMINRLIEEGRLSEVGLVVVDELHMIGDSGRGYLIELLLSKLLYASKKDQKLANRSNTVLQIVGMSATIPNLSDIASWIGALSFVTEYRPVPLYQRIVLKNDVFQLNESLPVNSTLTYSDALQLHNKIELADLSIKEEDASLIYSAIETLIEGHSVLVFCSTRKLCESISRSIAENIYQFGSKQKVPSNERTVSIGQKLVAALNEKKIIFLMKNLKQATGSTIDTNLEAVLKFGVAFHHAGLCTEERGILENAFRDGTVRILCATTTLSSGVNLPVRRVLISSPFDYKRDLLDTTVYQQMVGRAGRMGIDELGEAMLFCKDEFVYKNALNKLLFGQLASVKSCLFSTHSSHPTGSSQPNKSTSDNFIRAILEVISNGTAMQYSDIRLYVQSTFYYWQLPEFQADLAIDQAFETAFNYLLTNNLIEISNRNNIKDDSTKLMISPFGKSTVSSGFSPDGGQLIIKELKKAQKSVCLLNELHLIFLATQVEQAEQLDYFNWDNYLNPIYRDLDEDSKTIADLIGVNKEYIEMTSIYSKHSNHKPPRSSDAFVKQLVYKRFYISLALADLVQEMPLTKVAEKYKLTKGNVQSIQQQTAIFAGMMSTFCRKLGLNIVWCSYLAPLFEQVQARLSMGVQRELVDLMRISCLTSTTARQLFKKGLETLQILSYKKTSDIEEALISASVFEKAEAEVIDPASREMYIPKLNKCLPIPDLASLIRQEARALFEADVGQKLKFDDDHAMSSNEMETSLVKENLLTEDSLEGIEDDWNTEELEIMLAENLNANSTANRLSITSTSILDQSMMSVENENFDDDIEFFSSFNKRTLQKGELPKSFKASNTVVVPVEKFQTVSVCSQRQVEQLLEEIFASPLSGDKDAVLDIALHFTLEPIGLTKPNTSKEKVFRIEDRYSLQLKELFIARLGHYRIFHVNSAEMFECLQVKLLPRLQRLDPLFVDSLAETLSVSSLNHSLQSIPSRESVNSCKKKPRFRFITYDIKKAFYILQFGFKLPLNSLVYRIDWHDVSVALWLIDSDAKKFDIGQSSFNDIMQLALSLKLPVSYLQAVHNKLSKVRQEGHSSSSQTESMYKTAIMFYLIGHFCDRLAGNNQYLSYSLIELPCRSCVYRMETQGVLINEQQLSAEQTRLSQIREYLEEQIFYLAGKTFCLDSPEEVAKVLYTEQKCPEGTQSVKKIKLAGGASGRRLPQSMSTSKLALIKLQEACGSSTNLPTLIIEWRRVNHALEQTISPIARALRPPSKDHLSKGTRPEAKFIYSQCEEWSATGRISMTDPNLITVDKYFELSTVSETVEKRLLDEAYCTSPFSRSTPESSPVSSPDSGVSSPSSLGGNSKPVSIDLRQNICARKGYMLVSADYSQLELRILAHFTNDPCLMKTLNDPSNDVFKSIAAGWKNIPIAQVDDEMRQQAKQICYGVIYGIGDRSLAEKLAVTESEAAQFRKTFLHRYSKMRDFEVRVHADCSLNKHVETISHRRRPIKNIGSDVPSLQAYGRRQAVNSIIQGSAADIIKLAMVAVEKSIRRRPLLDASLVLQMHDELMYEVVDDGERPLEFAHLLKRQMEAVSRHLKVILPVKVRIGPNWGQMADLTL